jgi:phosphoglycerate kinase
MLEKYQEKIILPIDFTVSDSVENSENAKTKFITDFNSNDIGVDIGPQSIELFKQYLDNSKTIIWNGPVGIFEVEGFDKGTKALCEILKNNEGVTIIGGGDTASAAINFGYKDSFTHISTGGGASLEMLEGKVLPGVDIIEEK